MPELPDIALYVERLRERVVGRELVEIALWSPFLLRSLDPKPDAFRGLRCLAVDRVGKRIVFRFEGGLAAVIHLMIAGRFVWQSPLPPGKRPLGKVQLGAFRFENGQLIVQEASTRKRASLTLMRESDIGALDRGGLDVFSVSEGAFAERLRLANRTLKRALTDPVAFDGIGNAYSDEILFAARLSPVRLTRSLSDEECRRLLGACRDVLDSARTSLLAQIPGFPKPAQVTAFRPEHAVHGKFGHPCPVCGTKIQRIVYADNETNYCARCQNDGKVLADRSLSRLLKDDWPRELDE